MSRQRATQTIQKAPLFTFLDVLTCTMGLLILLLVAIARQSKLKSIDAVEAVRTVVVATQAEADALEQRLAALRISRTDEAKQLNSLQATLQDSHSRSRRLRDELAEIQRARALLEQSLVADPTEIEKAELARLESQIADLQARLSSEKNKGSSPSYAVVPYSGPNETRRRPIYIECRRDRIVLQPEGVALAERDFDGPLDNSNALAFAVRAAEQYLGRNSQSNAREAGEPYPLLLVRPDGINSYYVARAALKSWGSDFGYELIDEDWQLDFQVADASLAAVEAKAVEDARQRQQYLGYAGTGMGGRGSGRFSGGSRGTTGSFAQTDEEPTGGGRFRVAPDGRVVRESGSAYGSPRTRNGGSRLNRYAEITGEAPAGTSVTAENTEAASATSQAGGQPPAMADAPSANQTDAAPSGTTPGGPSFPPPAAPATATASGNPGGSAMGSPSDAAVASDQQGPQILPQKLFGQNAAQEAGPSSLADSQGKNWALPDSSRGSIPVTRPIKVQCLEDRIVVLPEVPGGPGRRDLPFAGQTANAVTGLVTVIWDRMAGWGIAGKGMYWRPELHVTTTPGGARRVAELKALLADSGVMIVERPTVSTARRF